MIRAAALLAALSLQVSAATINPTAPRPAAPPTQVRSAPTTAPPQRNYAMNLTTLIEQSQQIILVTPDLARADVAEAIRKAILGRGAEVVVISNERSYLTKNSYLFRLALMRSRAYSAPVTATPVLLLDGAAYAGPGVAGRGVVNRMDFTRNTELVRYLQRTITDLDSANKTVDPVELVRAWYRVNKQTLLW